jgi:flagellar biosynthetic protein FlhB
MAEETDLERSYPATPRRLEQAREHGQVARSRELTGAAVACAAALGLGMYGPHYFAQSQQLLREALAFDRAAAFSPDHMLQAMTDASVAALADVGPLLAILLVVTLAAPLAMSGWVFSVRALAPDFGRLDPLKGLSNLFSANGAAELVRSIVKSALLVAAGAWALVHLWNEMLGTLQVDVNAGVAGAGTVVMTGVKGLLVALVLIAAFDVPYQLWKHYKSLRMTREELRQELREQEGDPQLKARIRSLQRQVARKRMMAAVPTASVIVTNPTHYAVALQYHESMRAPKVVAKGTDKVAQKIREIGAAHGVPALEAPPLARALHKHTEIGQEVPHALYTVVAQVLAYVYQVQRWQQGAGGKAPVLPELAVPADLDPASRGAQPSVGEA